MRTDRRGGFRGETEGAVPGSGEPGTGPSVFPRQTPRRLAVLGQRLAAFAVVAMELALDAHGDPDGRLIADHLDVMPKVPGRKDDVAGLDRVWMRLVLVRPG